MGLAYKRDRIGKELLQIGNRGKKDQVNCGRPNSSGHWLGVLEIVDHIFTYQMAF